MKHTPEYIALLSQINLAVDIAELVPISDRLDRIWDAGFLTEKELTRLDDRLIVKTIEIDENSDG